MNSAITKAKIPIASSKINKFDIPSLHITTAGFMRFFPSYYRVVCKKSSLKVKHDTFIRTNPLDKPFYGNVVVNNRAFFVPYRVVWPAWQDYYNDVPHNTDTGTVLISKCPEMSVSTMIDAFCLYDAFSVAHSGSLQIDFYDNNGNPRVFTSIGRVAASFMAALGYRLFNSSSPHVYNCLQLLAAAKIFIDWYWPSAYAHYGNFAVIDGIFNRHFTYNISASDLYIVLSSILFVSYRSDFYTSLWDKSVGPNANTGSIDFQIPDVTVNYGGNTSSEVTNQYNTQYVPNPDNTPVIVSHNLNGTLGLSPSQLSNYALKSLERLTSYVRRHQLSGSRSLDRALAQYGVLLSAEKLQRCYYCGSDEFDLHVADVMSTAETSDASLGAYAGKAIASSVHDFDCYSDEEGVFMVINSVCPDVFYYQGIDPFASLRYKLDFHQPEFDALGVQAVPANELYIDDSSILATRNSVNSTFESQIFGYAPRYYYYKIPFNKLTGTFMFRNYNTDLKSWYIARKLTPPATLANFKHNYDFMMGIDAEQYTDVFLMPGDGKDLVDPFYIIHRDHLQLEAPMRPLYDNLDFEDEEDHPKVTTEPNGVKLN